MTAEPLSPRARRGLVLMSVAVVVLVTAAAVYVVRTWHTAPPAVQQWQLDYASFGDADHGAATMSHGGAIATFLTMDGGRTWRQRSAEPAATTFLDRDHAVMLDLGSRGIFGISANAGRTWDAASQPVTSVPVALRPGGILGGPFFLDPSDGWWLAAGPGAVIAALWRTADGGRTWHDLAPSGIPAPSVSPPQLVFVDRLRGALVAPGGHGRWPTLLTTGDGGRTWRPAALEWPPVDIVPADPTDPSVAVAALTAHRDRIVLSLDYLVGGVQGPVQAVGRSSSVSQDGGLTWAPWQPTPGRQSIESVTTLDDAGRLAVADDRHLWTSTDLGRTWRSRPLPALGGRPVSSEVIAAGGGALFVVSLRDAGNVWAATLLRSLDGGGSWAQLSLPAPGF
jgi:photosystem II stability/assembly factor-like uncharacterized protein